MVSSHQQRYAKVRVNKQLTSNGKWRNQKERKTKEILSAVVMR